MQLPVLNLPPGEFRYNVVGQSKQIFDCVRKRFVALTEEEWVRQNFMFFMIHSKKYPASLMGIEKMVKVNNLSQRADIVVYQRNGLPWMIVECKSVKVSLTENTFYQAARYSSTLKVPYFVITNGLNHYCLHFNGQELKALSDLPEFDQYS
jgi:type I site-specific restriction endonuclease